MRSGCFAFSPSRRRSLITLGSLAILGSQPVARAAEFPDRPLRLIVGFPPGGGSDVLARLMAQSLGDALGTTVVVENRGGAGGTIAAAIAARAPADGYTLFLGNTGAILTAPSLYPTLPYDPRNDFVPVASLGSYPNVLYVPVASDIRSIDDLVRKAKANPGKIFYGSSGIGSTLHLSMVLLQELTGIKVEHVPYTSGSTMQTDLIEGRLDCCFASTALQPHVEAGRLRAVASTGAKRPFSFPQVPTVAEQGFAAYECVNWFSILAPRGTPSELVQKLNAGVVQGLGKAEMRSKLEQDLDFYAKPTPPQEAAELIRSEQDRWARVIKNAHISLK